MLMANDLVPFVAIIGGLRDLDPATLNSTKQFAREIGAALAKAGLGLVVYHSDEESLEPHVVSGYAPGVVAGTGDGLIRVRFAESQRGQVHFMEQTTHGSLFESRLFPGQDWESPFYRSLAASDGVDAVLLVAGARSTLIAGQIAVARKLPVLAIDQFGGAAGVIWTELARSSSDYPSLSTHSPPQLVRWLKTKCAQQTTEREQARRQAQTYADIASATRKTTWTLAAFGTLLATVYFGMAKTPEPGFYPFLTFAGLIAAGATGALARSVIWGANETATSTSLTLGAIAGFVVGLAYLIPQWVGAPGVLKTTVTSVDATDKIQFASSVLVAISAGVGFDTVFTRLKKEAEGQAIGPGR
jgi:hypothetical protein